MVSDTIFAMSSGAGRAGIAVVRTSGPQAGEALSAMLGGKGLPQPRRALLTAVVDPRDGITIDRCLVLWFPAPSSFTGEDVFELHLHGGRAVLDAALSALAAFPGLRPAEPGEFTRRAFDNGLLDLTAVEGLADLITAETEAQRRQALRQLEGGLSAKVQAWQTRLVKLLAETEAWIDFPDEDLPENLVAGHAREVEKLALEMEGALASGLSARRLREGVMIAIIGPPNAGKSSIINRLAKRDAAIVSEIAGTTRDVVEVHLSLSGFPVTVADTAGLREAEAGELDPIEREGIRRSRDRASSADFLLGVFDLRDFPELDRETLGLLSEKSLVLLNKADLASEPDASLLQWQSGIAPEVICISAVSGAGFNTLEAALEKRLRAELSDALAAPGFSRLRHEQCLRDCVVALRGFDPRAEVELQAEELRIALRTLGRLLGRVDVEDLLDVIFRDFCIGK